MGGIAITLAIAAALWFLYDGMRGGGKKRPVLFKSVAWLALSAVALAGRLWPLALLTLFAAGAVALIEWLKDRRWPDEDAPEAGAPRAASGPMSVSDARAVLGVDETAGPDDVRAAHRRLIARVHPDGGGSDFLAAQINRAREVLLEALD